MSHADVQALGVWPEIAGVDSEMICDLLGGDVALFESLLLRLLDDFDELEAPVVLDGEGALEQLAVRMHRLRGAAGQLAVRGVYTTASALEDACRARDASAALGLCGELWSQMKQLRVASAAAFKALRPSQPPSAPAAGVQLSQTQVAKVVVLLREQNLAVLSQLPALTNWARHELPLAATEHLEEHLRRMRFAEAAALLSGLVPWLATG